MNRMNEAKAFFTRGGGSLAALLLAASPGVALAQDIGFGFNPDFGSVAENATDKADTPPRLTTKLTARGLPPVGTPNRRSEALKLGSLPADTSMPGGIQLRNVPDSGANRRYSVSHVVEPGTTAVRHHFINSDDIVLTIAPIGSNDPDWKDNKYVFKVVTDRTAISPHPGTFDLTIVDDEVPPVLEFTREKIKLTRGSRTSVQVRLAPGAPGASIPSDPDVGTVFNDRELKIAVSDPDRITTFDCATAATAVLDVSTSGDVIGPEDGILSGNEIPDIEMEAQTFTFEACSGAPGFRDSVITFTFDEKGLMAELGNLAAGNFLTVTVENNAEPPAVGFTTTSVLIEEGGANTVGVAASGPWGDEVGSVGVTVSGEAAVTLWQGGEQLEANADGSFTIDFGDRANTLLEIRASADETLADGERKTATVAITDANGAALGDRKALSITVSGAAAVPVLPLAGQLLLALLLAAGGARLYRRPPSPARRGIA